MTLKEKIKLHIIFAILVLLIGFNDFIIPRKEYVVLIFVLPIQIFILGFIYYHRFYCRK